MNQNKKNLILTAAVAVILTLGLTVGFSPSVSLRDRILDAVQLPRKVFSYLLGDHPTSPKEETEAEETLAQEETIDQSPAEGQNAASQPAAPQEPPRTETVTETPIDFFTEDDPIDLTQPTTPADPAEEEGEEPTPDQPTDPNQKSELPTNQLPDHILE